jgi:DNA-binding transcriptional MerR regulator
VSAKIQIGKVAKASGSSIDTIRYYERLGLLPPAERKKSGYRLYSPEIASRVQFIRQARAVGFRLDEIRAILRMKYADQSPCECTRQMLQRRLADMEEQSKTLANFRR